MRNQDHLNPDQDRRYSPESQGFSHNNSYDTRTYYTGQGHGSREYMADGRGSYEQGDMETRWDHYNAANYGQSPVTSRRTHVETYRSSGRPNDHFEQDDYRYTSGNREWHLNEQNRESRNERMHDRYNHPNRYSEMHNRNNEGGRDMFERVGDGISRAWNGITGNRDNNRPDRDRDYHQSYQNESRSYGVSEENIRRYGNKPIQGYERGEHFGDDTPEQQHRTNYRSQQNQGYGNNRSGSNFNRNDDF